MYTEDPSSFDRYLSQNALAASHLTPSVSARIPIEALREEDEDDAPAHSSTLDPDQALSAALLSETKEDAYTPAAPPISPHIIPASSSDPAEVSSASPAAAFLSFFHSPVPTETRPQDDEGQVISGYCLGSIIGYGSTSIIRRASSSSGNIAAVKIIRRSDLVKAGNAPQARKRLQHEAAVWITLSHEHILPLFSVAHTAYADYFFTLYCPAGSLFDILKRDGTPALPQDDAGMMFRQVVRGLRYLHEVANYVHRDMKLENVLVDDMGVCKIGDFGMSRQIGAIDDKDEDQEDHPRSDLTYLSSGIHRAVSLTTPSKKAPKSHPQLNHSLILRHNSTRHRNSTSTNEPTPSFQPGSLPYAAPELLLPQTSDVLQPHPSQDIWALGVMLYTLLTGQLPFRDTFEPRLQMKILNGTYTVPEGIGRGAERILEGCLERSVPNRWTIAMVDEVAWGVGWGAEGDDAASTEEERDAQHPPTISRSRSQSLPRPLLVSVSSGTDWQQDEPRSRPSIDAASRRSSSRAKRSLSRAPALQGKSDDSRSASRSVSRHPRSRSPASAGLRSSIAPSIITPSSSLSAPSDIYDGYIDSALDICPSPPPSSSSRGRRHSKPHHPASRSPSPSIVPTTPKDDVLVTSLSGMVEPPALHLDHDSSSRGRRTIRTLGTDKPYDGLAQSVPSFEGELEDGDEAMMRSGPLVPEDSNRHRKFSADMEGLRAEAGWRPRPSSSPPMAQRLTPSYLDPFLNSSASSSSINLITRSRSAETPR